MKKIGLNYNFVAVVLIGFLTVLSAEAQNIQKLKSKFRDEKELRASKLRQNTQAEVDTFLVAYGEEMSQKQRNQKIARHNRYQYPKIEPFDISAEVEATNKAIQNLIHTALNQSETKNDVRIVASMLDDIFEARAQTKIRPTYLTLVNKHLKLKGIDEAKEYLVKQLRGGSIGKTSYRLQAIEIRQSRRELRKKQREEYLYNQWKKNNPEPETQEERLKKSQDNLRYWQIEDQIERNNRWTPKD